MYACIEYRASIKLIHELCQPYKMKYTVVKIKTPAIEPHSCQIYVDKISLGQYPASKTSNRRSTESTNRPYDDFQAIGSCLDRVF